MLNSNKTNIAMLIEYRKRGVQHVLLLKKLSEDDETTYDLPLFSIDEFEHVFTHIKKEVTKLTSLKVAVLEDENEMSHYKTSHQEVMTYRSFCSCRTIGIKSGEHCHIEVLRCKAEGSLNYIENKSDLFLMVSLDEASFMIEDSPERFNPMIVNAIKKYLKYAGYLAKSSK